MIVARQLPRRQDLTPSCQRSELGNDLLQGRVLQLRAVAMTPNRFSRYAYERIIAVTPSGVQTYASVPAIAMAWGLWSSSSSALPHRD